MKALIITFTNGEQEVFLMVGENSNKELVDYLCGDSNLLRDSHGKLHEIESSEWVNIINKINLRDLSDLLLKEENNANQK